MPFVHGIVAFVVSLLVGGLGIYVGARIVVGRSSYGHALTTALVGAVVWAIASIFIGWLPLVGPLLVLLAWIWVVKSRYGVGWVDAAIIGFLAWVAAVVILAVLPFGGGAFGIPFV